MADETTKVATQEEDDDEILVDEKPVQEPKTEQPPVVEDTRPDWLDKRFLSPEEQAKAYREAEAKMHDSNRRADESTKKLLESQNLIDEYILSTINRKNPTVPTEPTGMSKILGIEDNIIRDDIARMQRPIYEPLLNMVEDLNKEIKGLKGEIHVVREHGDHFQIVNSPEFAEWGQKHLPAGIIDAGMRDPSSASWIVSEFKKYKGNGEKAPPPTTEEIPPITTKKPPISEDAHAQPITSKKTYTRSELVKISMDEDKAAEMHDEIIAAYKEGRVKSG